MRKVKGLGVTASNYGDVTGILLLPELFEHIFPKLVTQSEYDIFSQLKPI